jgi:hypothetical protein
MKGFGDLNASSYFIPAVFVELVYSIEILLTYFIRPGTTRFLKEKIGSRGFKNNFCGQDILRDNKFLK